MAVTFLPDLRVVEGVAPVESEEGRVVLNHDADGVRPCELDLVGGLVGVLLGVALLEKLDDEVRVRDLLPVELDVGRLALAAGLETVDVLILDVGQSKPWEWGNIEDFCTLII